MTNINEENIKDQLVIDNTNIPIQFCIQNWGLPFDRELLKKAIKVITHLNPKPGGSDAGEVAPFLQPDFIVSQLEGKLEIKLNTTLKMRINVNLIDL